MASLNLSINGASIKSSYAGVVNGTATSSSPTHSQWALFSVQAPLVSAFQNTGGKESILKVESTGNGELSQLAEEFNDGRIQFAFVKVRDPNSGLPKYVLIGWCGEGVPERTKGFYTSHLVAVGNVLHGAHVQVTARSEADLEPAMIMKKVSDASGAKYTPASTAGAAPVPPQARSKPVFTPTRSTAGTVDPIVAARSQRDANVDSDGWGPDAPPVTRHQIEKVAPAYQPVKVNMAELTSQKSEPSRYAGGSRHDTPPADVVKGGYQAVGKVDIAAIRAEAQRTGDDRPTPIKGSYQAVGKVDIAAIRANAQRPDDEPENKSFSERAAAFSKPNAERLTILPKPKPGKFAGGAAFTGTRAPAPPPAFGGPQVTAPAPVTGASRAFANSEDGKTPAQVWAEKNAKKGRQSISSIPNPPTPPVVAQKSGNEWKSGYTGKTWASVQTAVDTRGPQVSEDLEQQRTGEAAHHVAAEPDSPARGVTALRGQFKNTVPISAAAPPPPPANRPYEEEEELAAPPPPPQATHPVGGFKLPGLPSRPPPVDDDEEDSASGFQAPAPREPSPIRVAAPVAREVLPLTEEPPAPPHIPTSHIPVPREEELHEEREVDYVARGAATAVAEQTFEAAPVAVGQHEHGSKRAVVLYDYEKAEDNEIDLIEGQYVSNIDQVDEDWWLGVNAAGETGLFPSNYVELVEDDGAAPPPPAPAPTHAPAPAHAPAAPEPEYAAESHDAHHAGAGAGATATALYDYEAAEDNELSFPEDATITNLEFPDEDWWFGHFNGHQGLFPANYVQLNA